MMFYIVFVIVVLLWVLLNEKYIKKCFFLILYIFIYIFKKCNKIMYSIIFYMCNEMDIYVDKCVINYSLFFFIC